MHQGLSVQDGFVRKHRLDERRTSSSVSMRQPQPSREPVQSLWIGDALSTLERLSIASFLDNGFEYHLYVYQEVASVPRGTLVKDAREILPETMIFRYTRFESYSGFSNYFRYKLLLERGGWWMDTDVVCLKPFQFDRPHVFSSEPGREGGECVASGIIKAPVGSPAMRFAWETCLRTDPKTLFWGETGPRLVAEAVR